MATIEDMVKDLNESYPKAITQVELHRAWELGRTIEAEMVHERFSATKTTLINDVAKAIIPGAWARYYEVRKFDRTEENIGRLYKYVKDYWEAIDKKDVELAVNYGYLLSVILGELKGDPEGAQKINEEISQLVKDTGNVPLGLKVINTRGLNAIQRKDWPEAIGIFSQAEQNFREALNIPEAQQHFANTLNNRGLTKLNLSDGVDDWKEKRGLISSAVIDLWNAEELYMRVTPPPLKHIDGLKNRLIMAASRLLLTERFIEKVEIGRKIKEAFEVKDREKAKSIILGLKELKVISWDKTEGEISGDTMTFIGSIQIGLRMADEFLEKHKEGK